VIPEVSSRSTATPRERGGVASTAHRGGRGRGTACSIGPSSLSSVATPQRGIFALDSP